MMKHYVELVCDDEELEIIKSFKDKCDYSAIHTAKEETINKMVESKRRRTILVKTIKEMRDAGNPYRIIAEVLGIPQSVVRELNK